MCNFYKTVWCEKGLKLADMGTKNLREEEMNHRLVYAMLRLDHWQTNCKIGVTGYRIVWITMCHGWINWIEFRIQLNQLEIFIWDYNYELEFRIMNITLENVL